MLVQYLAFAVLILVMVGCLIDFKKTVIIWLSAQLLFNAQIALRYSPPALSLVLGINLFLFCYYIIKRNSIAYKLNNEPFILFGAMCLVISSYILSSLFGDIQSFKGITTTIKYFGSGFCLLILAQKVLNTKEDLKLYLRSSAIIFGLIVALAISETIIQHNLWLDFVYYNSPINDDTLGRMFYNPMGMQMRYGMVRAQSTFGIHLAFGYACCMYFWLFALLSRGKRNFLPLWQLYLLSILLAGGVFMANSKTGYVGICFMLMSIYSLKHLFNVKIVFPVICMMIVILVYFPDYLNNYFSLFDSNLADEGGGSTVEGRKNQFDVALRMFDRNPLFGNGLGSISLMMKHSNYSDILGAESSWMQILPERGLYGAIAYIYMYWVTFVRFKKYIPAKIVLFFLLGLGVMETATGVLNMAVWGVVLLAMKRLYQIGTLQRAKI